MTERFNKFKRKSPPL